MAMMTTTDMTTIPSRNSQMRSQYSVADERQIQPYQHPGGYQAWAAEGSKEPFVSSNINRNDSVSFKKYLTTKCVMSFLIGFIICGIPLAIMGALYAQKTSSNSSSGSSNPTSSTNLPTQCTSYTSIADTTRLTSYTSCVSCFWDISPYFIAGWYRFIAPGGTQMPAMPPSTGACGAAWPTWYNGTYPSTSGSTVSSAVCAQASGTLCHPSYYMPVSITNCNGYYVFYLTPVSTTNIRYCASF
ncbi:unnamed protein product [Rotaria socialis]|uniref:UMOD/GP2/OIT3-like D8C domain-containing protein n=1 Tax=Rotaria socialis TaxID=392032 RepID=A0A821A333_9BILA|nr:unnamed protein product [Rotaria socialis]CAF4571165.1 unnamed protein product [Rotaria socialis]